jgi:hypothetical protein
MSTHKKSTRKNRSPGSPARRAGPVTRKHKCKCGGMLIVEEQGSKTSFSHTKPVCEGVMGYFQFKMWQN